MAPSPDRAAMPAAGGSRAPMKVSAACAAAVVALAALVAAPQSHARAGKGGTPRAVGGAGSVPQARTSAAAFARGTVLLEFRPGTSGAREHAIERAVGGRDMRSLNPWRRAAAAGVPLTLDVSPGRVSVAVARLHRFASVRYAEPDRLVEATAAPNDPSFEQQWADSNTGQLVPVQTVHENEEKIEGGARGTSGDDANVLNAWGTTTGSPSIVVAVVDAGVAYEHPDLRENIWTNTTKVFGCTNGTHGFNVAEANKCDPLNTELGPPAGYGGHGTHVAGIIGAQGDNGAGVAGINWHTTILPIKWLPSAMQFAPVSRLIEGIEAVLRAQSEGVNIRVVNDSAVFHEKGAPPPEALRSEIEELGKRNILFVTAAGNAGTSIESPEQVRYPCSFESLPNLLCVTATNDNDELTPFADYGPKVVDLAAPGESIFSTFADGPIGEEQYGYLSGTSMAAAEVSGASALVLSSVPSLTASQLRADILEHVTKVPALAERVSSGGILNVCDAIPLCLNPPPSLPPVTPPPPPPPPPPPVEVQIPAVTLAHATVTAGRRGTVALVLRCAKTAPSCTGRISLHLTGVRVTRRLHGHIVHSTIAVTVATASFTIAGGASRKLILHLSARARGMLAQHHTLHLKATVLAHGTNGSTRSAHVTVTVRPPRHR